MKKILISSLVAIGAISCVLGITGITKSFADDSKITAPISQEKAAPSSGAGSASDPILSESEVKAYVKSEIDKLRKELSNGGSVTPPPSQSTNASITGVDVYLRRNPSYSANDNIRILKVGTKVKLISTSGDFAKIEHNGTTGYVLSKYVTKDGGSTPPPVTSKKGTVTASSYLNVRQSPNTSSAVVGKLASKSTVEILESSNGWYKIKQNSIVGWASASYIAV